MAPFYPWNILYISNILSLLKNFPIQVRILVMATNCGIYYIYHPSIRRSCGIWFITCALCTGYLKTDISYTCCWRTRSIWFPPDSISETCCDVTTSQHAMELIWHLYAYLCGGGGGGTMWINRWVCFHHTWYSSGIQCWWWGGGGGGLLLLIFDIYDVVWCSLYIKTHKCWKNNFIGYVLIYIHFLFSYTIHIQTYDTSSLLRFAHG